MNRTEELAAQASFILLRGVTFVPGVGDPALAALPPLTWNPRKRMAERGAFGMPRPRSQDQPEVIKQIRILASLKFSEREIADEIGLTRSRVRGICHRHAIFTSGVGGGRSGNSNASKDRSR